MKVLLFVLSLLSITTLQSNSPDTRKFLDIVKDPKPINTESLEDISDSLYSEIIEHIKGFEGYRGDLYIDNDGSPTIGYGHHLVGNETYKQITKEKADQILKNDFEERVQWVKDTYHLKSQKAYAVALFVYNCGSGTYSRSSLKTAIESNLPIDDIIVQYCKYKKDGIYHTSSGLLKRRQFELSIFNS